VLAPLLAFDFLDDAGDYALSLWAVSRALQLGLFGLWVLPGGARLLYRDRNGGSARCDSEPPATSTGHEHLNHGAMTGHENMDHGASGVRVGPADRRAA
jgi:hypothetical protein